MVPIYVGEKITGVLEIGYEFDDELAEYLKKATGSDVTFFFGDDIVASSFDGVTRKALLEQLKDERFKANLSGELLTMSIGNEKYITMASTISGDGSPKEGWYLIQSSEEKLIRPYKWLQNMTLMTGLIAALLSGLFGFHLAREIAGPISHVVKATESVRSGEWPEPIPVAKDADAGMLARTINEMVLTLKENQERFKRSIQALKQQEQLRALGQMASGIVHDINNSLVPIAVYVEILMSEPDLKEEIKSYLSDIKTSCNDIIHIISRLKEFYRRKDESLSLEAVDLNALAKHVVKLTSPRWYSIPAKHGITNEIVFELDDNCPQIMGIESEIREALTNLIFNAIDAMPKGGTLRLRTSVRTSPGITPGSTTAADGKEEALLEVIDMGIGMDEETTRRCLEPFFHYRPDDYIEPVSFPMGLPVLQSK